MSSPAPEPRVMAAAWCVTVPAAVVAACTVIGLVALGPFALIALPFALPPLVVVAAQARAGYRVARGRTRSTRALFLMTLAVAGLLAVVAIFARSEDSGRPDMLNLVAGLAAVVECAAAVVLLPSALRGRERLPLSRAVALALSVLAVAQLAALTLPRASTSPLP